MNVNLLAIFFNLFLTFLSIIYGLKYTINPFKSSYSRLFSLGDPDLSPKWSSLRIFQDWARKYDYLLFPEEPDCPNWTFPSPIIWAPWMETIWFGNLYEYRSAYFQDVMYSNHVPNREGALLYRDPSDALTLALLYQRYPKFDTSCYNVPNATFYNIFGTQSMRLGRYKIPLTKEVILCITDPLTFSEMKRYLTSFAPLKWFKSQFFQQKRKRQYVMNISSDSFLRQSIEYLEYGRIGITNDLRGGSSNPWNINNKNSDKNGKNIIVATYPNKNMSDDNIYPIKSNTMMDNTSNSNNDDECQLLVKLSHMNSQYYIENLIQVIYDVYVLSRINNLDNNPVVSDPKRNFKTNKKSVTILLGSDGRLLSDLFLNTVLRVLSGQSYDNCNILIAQYGILTSSQTKYTMEQNEAIDIGIILTGGESMAGIRGYHGMNVIIRNHFIQNNYSNNFMESIDYLTRLNWKNIIKLASENKNVGIKSIPIPYSLINSLKLPSSLSKQMIIDKNIKIGTNVNVEILESKDISSVLTYLSKKSLNKLKKYILSNELIIVIDCMNVPSTIQYVESVVTSLDMNWKEIGINIQPLADFGMKVPIATPEYATDSITLFGLESTMNSSDIDIDSENDNNNNNKNDNNSDGSGIDIGFVISGDSRSCMILADGIVVKPKESRKMVLFYIEQFIQSMVEMESKITTKMIRFFEILKKETDGVAIMFGFLFILSQSEEMGILKTCRLDKSLVQRLIHNYHSSSRLHSKSREDIPNQVIEYQDSLRKESDSNFELTYKS